MRKFQNNDIVYVNSSWNKAEPCKVVDYFENESSTGENVYKLISSIHGGTFGATEECVFATKEKALEAHIEKRNQRVEKYKSEINDIEDLLNFPLEHCIIGDEYTDYAAREAYIIRAKELTNIVLKN